VFNKIEKKDFKKIVEIFVNSLESQLSTQNISLKISDDVISNIADVDISDKIGARQFRKIIIEKIEKPMAAFMIKNDIEKGATITCNIIENKIKFEIEK
jgi:ATP-dependent Clp protease ATP-binding subunit ClpA